MGFIVSSVTVGRSTDGAVNVGSRRKPSHCKTVVVQCSDRQLPYFSTDGIGPV
jgi:hypothetical protein